MYIINDEEINKYFHHVFIKLIGLFPETFLYQFNIICENKYDCKTKLASDIYEYLH